MHTTNKFEHLRRVREVEHSRGDHILIQRTTNNANTVTSQPQGEGKKESDQTANKRGREGGAERRQTEAATPNAETNTAPHAATGGRKDGRTDASETRLKRRPEELKPQGGQRPTGSPTRGSEATGPEGGRARRDHCGLRSYGTWLSREEKGCEATLGHDRDVPRGASEHCGAMWFVRGCVLPQEWQNLRTQPPASLYHEGHELHVRVERRGVAQPLFVLPLPCCFASSTGAREGDSGVAFRARIGIRHVDVSKRALVITEPDIKLSLL